MNKELLKILSDLGYPILVAILFGVGFFWTFKFILSETISSIKRIHNIVFHIESKIKTLTNNIAVLDILVSAALNVKLGFLNLTTKLEKNDDR